MFAFVVESEPIVIDAPANVVWDILLDADRYEAWNPFTTRIDTDFEPGSPIHMHVVLGPLKHEPGHALKHRAEGVHTETDIGS